MYLVGNIPRIVIALRPKKYFKQTTNLHLFCPVGQFISKCIHLDPTIDHLLNTRNCWLNLMSSKFYIFTCHTNNLLIMTQVSDL